MACEYVAQRLNDGTIRCVVIIGLPQWGREEIEDALHSKVNGLVRVSADDYFYDEDGRYVFEGSKLHAARETARAALLLALPTRAPILACSTDAHPADLKRLDVFPFDAVVCMPSTRDRAVQLGRAKNATWKTPQRVLYRKYEDLAAREESLHRGRYHNLQSIVRVEI